MSETEIRRRRDDLVARGQTRLVDLGFRYAGMGHVRVLTYDPLTDGVFEAWDGGANDWDRTLHHRERIQCDVDACAKQPFDAWAARIWCHGPE